MPTYRAYCTGCDAEIDVRIGPDGPARLELRDIVCPHDDLCGEEHCVLARDSGRPLREMLEFLPAEDEGGADTPERGFAESSRQVEETRRASLAREMRRLRRWWGKGE